MKKIIILITSFLPSLMHAQNRYDIVISEIMADPTPAIGLPSNEWLELRNTTTVPINLQGWRIGDATGQSGPMPNFLLQPDSCVIVCTGSAVAVMKEFGTTISVTSFPSLDNDADQLFLKSASGKIIHAVSYTSEWYNEVKKDGGWTLEMIDTKSPCSGSDNWAASINVTGGTPGHINSINGITNDITAPKLKNAYSTNDTTIVIIYDEPVDSLSGAALANYGCDGGLSFISAVTTPPLFNQVQLITNTSLAPNTVYTISAINIKDCKGNTIDNTNKIKVGIPSDPSRGEWIINEILFNPRTNANDYVEFYNNSSKIFDAAKLYIANRNSAGVVSSIRGLSAAPHYIFPGDHIVVTEDADNLALQYLVKNPENVLTVASPPSFPDDEGTVIALNFQGDIVDEVKYKDDWHFKLIDNSEGISLERIDPAGISQNESNWHSAASSAGYGTPTYKNSQYKLASSITSTIEVVPKVFSPDNDGRDDVVGIQYGVTEPGYVANVIIFDASGGLVRILVRNSIMALKGQWNWDGLDDRGNKLPIGTYIIFTEQYNLRGKKETFKNTVVLARHLN